jgi:hypothetical protein
MKLLLKLIFWLLLLSSSQNLKAEFQKVLLKNENQSLIDLCGNQNLREILLTVNLGDVKISDSLLSYEFIIQYDTSKVRFQRALTLNTLASFFDIDNSTVSNSEARIYGSGGQLNNLFKPVAGSRPLIAFLGNFIGNCGDSTNISMYKIEMNNEFKIKYDTTNPSNTITIYGDVIEKNERNLKLSSFDTVSILFDTVISREIVLGSQIDNSMNNIELSFEYDKSLLSITDFISNGKSKLEVDTIIENSLGCVVRLSRKSKVKFDDTLAFKMKSIQNKENESKIEVKLLNLDKCSCITGSNNLLSSVTHKKKSVSSVEIENENDVINYQIFDYYGRNIVTIENLEDIQNLTRGLYFIKVNYSNQNSLILKKIIN